MEMAVEQFQKDLVEQLTVRSSRRVFDNLTVETPDGKFPLIQLGQIVYKIPQTCYNQYGSCTPQCIPAVMAALPQCILAVMAALLTSGMNLNPQQQSTTVVVPIPRGTREHRENLAKRAKAVLSKRKEKLRDNQNKFLRDVKKAENDHGYDLVYNVREMIEAAAKRYITQAEQMTETKRNEILNK